MSSSVDVFVLWVAGLSEWGVCGGVGCWGVGVLPLVVLVVTCSVEVKSMVVVTGMVGVGLSMGAEGGMWLFWMCASVVSAIFFVGEVLLLSD